MTESFTRRFESDKEAAAYQAGLDKGIEIGRAEGIEPLDIRVRALDFAIQLYRGRVCSSGLLVSEAREIEKYLTSNMTLSTDDPRVQVDGYPYPEQHEGTVGLSGSGSTGPREYDSVEDETD